MDQQKARAAIKAAFICGVISTSITLVATLVALFRGGFQFSGMPISVFTLIDVLLLAGLTVGLFFKSRVCATLMLVYFVWCKYLQWSSVMQISSLLIGLLFLYFYAQGVRGTFVFWRLEKKRANQPPEPTAMSVTPPASQEPRQP